MDTTTRIADTYKLGRSLLREFGLDDWTFDISNHKRIMGQCDHETKTIVFSFNFLLVSMEEIEDTIRHEIAHALVGMKHGHDDVWKLKCIEVGAKPIRCYDGNIKSAAKPNYIMKCPDCGKRWERFRMRRRNFGAKCPDCNVVVEIYKVKEKK